MANGLETLPKISIAWVGCTNVTDGRTIAYSEREGEFTVAKNRVCTFLSTVKLRFSCNFVHCKYVNVFLCLVECPASSGFKYTSNSGNRTCLKLIQQKFQWSSASTECPSRHSQAHLVVINGTWKQMAVKNLVDGEDMSARRFVP